MFLRPLHTASSYTYRHYTTASRIFLKSGYSKVDYRINQNKCVQQAVIRFAALDIGCVAVVDDDQKFVDLFSEGDFIKKVASSGKEAAAIQLKEICTQAPNVLIAKPTDSLEDCMVKMHLKNIRHLPIIDENQDLKGLISIKDLFVEQIHQNTDLIERLGDFKLGKGCFFGSENINDINSFKKKRQNFIFHKCVIYER